MKTCPQCKGKKYEVCTRCNGTGKEPLSAPDPCRACAGKGRNICATCRGKGVIRIIRTKEK